jgi:hypothetical protein
MEYEISPNEALTNMIGILWRSTIFLRKDHGQQRTNLLV